MAGGERAHTASLVQGVNLRHLLSACPFPLIVLSLIEVCVHCRNYMLPVKEYVSVFVLLELKQSPLATENLGLNAGIFDTLCGPRGPILTCTAQLKTLRAAGSHHLSSIGRHNAHGRIAEAMWLIYHRPVQCGAVFFSFFLSFFLTSLEHACSSFALCHF